MPVQIWNPESVLVAGGFFVSLGQFVGLSGVLELDLLDSASVVVGSMMVEGNFRAESVVGAYDNISCLPNVVSVRVKAFITKPPYPVGEQVVAVTAKRLVDDPKAWWDWDFSVVAAEPTTFDRDVVVVQSNLAGDRAAFLGRIPGGSTVVNAVTVESVDFTETTVMAYRKISIVVCSQELKGAWDQPPYEVHIEGE